MTTVASTPAFELVRSVPKVLLHDHLDGGLRPMTVLELAREVGYTALPTNDGADLQAGSAQAPIRATWSCTWRVSLTPWP